MDATVRILPSIKSLDQSARDWLDGASDNPFVSYAFLSALEDSGSATPDTGWGPQHLMLMDSADQPLAFMPLYLKGHSQGEYVFDHSWANAWEHAGGSYYPKLLSSIPFTPATGPRIVGDAQHHQLILDAVAKITADNGLSSAHITFAEPDFAKSSASDDWMLRTDQQFHWINRDYKTFSDFLDALSSRKRKQIRKERRTAAGSGLTIKTLTGDAINNTHWDAFYTFYTDTGERKWGQPYLTRTFFSMIGERMPDQIVLMLAERDGVPVAGALNFISNDAIYGRHWGCTEHHDCLHFELCYYQAIDWAIANGLSTVEAGAQGPHKLARGYEPVTTYSLHHIPNESFRGAVKQFLKTERKHVEVQGEYLAEHLPFKREDTQSQ